MALGSLALSFLVATFMAGAGVLISLHAATVQEASQRLLLLLFVPGLAMQVVLLLFRDRMGAWIERVDGLQLLIIILAVLAVSDLGVFIAAMTRFQRTRLVLD